MRVQTLLSYSQRLQEILSDLCTSRRTRVRACMSLDRVQIRFGTVYRLHRSAILPKQQRRKRANCIRALYARARKPFVKKLGNLCVDMREYIRRTQPKCHRPSFSRLYLLPLLHSQLCASPRTTPCTIRTQLSFLQSFVATPLNLRRRAKA